MLALATISSPTVLWIGGCSLFMLVYGLFSLINPAKAWLWGRRWQFRGEPEPSDASLCLTRVAGLVLILAGLFFAFIAIAISIQAPS